MRRHLLTFSISALCLLSFAADQDARPTKEEDKSPSGAIDERKLVDLTHAFDSSTVYWPNAQPFEWKKESWGMTAGGYWYTAAHYAASEHGGTHLDSPIHFGEGKAALDELPVAQFVGPAVVVDISEACARDADYRLRPEDISAWEKKHGAIPAGAIVLVRTGWGRFWPDKKKYLGDDTPGRTTGLHFPGISREAAELLVARRVDGVGIDTASTDYGQSRDFPAHRVLAAANIYGLENVADLERLPATGATLIALPMKIKGGTGGPVRIIALLP
ncbi:MAG TPA: cyclase family protein [Terriglobales bacterium]|nr:cyclase family protein [Terriglobales bacterium]